MDAETHGPDGNVTLGSDAGRKNGTPDAPPSLDRWLRVIADHAEFGTAMRLHANAMLTMTAQAQGASLIFRDIGSLTTARLAMQFNAGGPFKLTRLRMAAEASGLLSSGRAHQLARMMEGRGLLDPQRPAEASRRGFWYVAGPALCRLWQHHLTCLMVPAGRVLPGLAGFGGLTDDPRLLGALSLRHGLALDAFPTLVAQDSIWTRNVLHAYGGLQLTWLILARIHADLSGPRDDIGRVSLWELSRRFGYSRIHFKRTLRRAEEAGLMLRDGDGYLLTPLGAAELRDYGARQLAGVALAAMGVVDAIRDGGDGLEPVVAVPPLGPDRQAMGAGLGAGTGMGLQPGAP